MTAFVEVYPCLAINLKDIKSINLYKSTIEYETRKDEVIKAYQINYPSIELAAQVYNHIIEEDYTQIHYLHKDLRVMEMRIEDIYEVDLVTLNTTTIGELMAG